MKRVMNRIAAGLLALSAASAFAAQVPTGLDSISGSLTWKLQGLSTEFNAWAGTNESTWGIGRVTQLVGNNGNNQTWTAGDTDGTYLYYMIYGISDLNVRDNGDGGFTIFNNGATGGVADGKIHIDLYRSSVELTSIVDGTTNPNVRTAYNMISLFSALGPAYLTAEFGLGKQSVNLADRTLCSTPGVGTPTGIACETAHANETLATLVQNTNSATLPASGSGNFFADVTGGTAATKWNSNGIAGHDFDASFTLRPNDQANGGSCTTAQLAANDCFTGNINDPIRSTALPEPAGIALVGLALGGLAVVRRRTACKS